MRWVWFGDWLAVGAGYGVSLLGAVSIGLFVLPLPVLATVLLARRQSARAGLPGLVSGLGVPLGYVAYLNRSGPGTSCTTTTRPAGQRCVDESSPWPWLAVAATLFVLGLVAFLLWQRHVAAQRSGDPATRHPG